MKKLLLIVLLAFNTTFLSAQINLIHSFNSWEVFPFMKGSETWYAYVNYETISIDLLRPDFSLYKKVVLPVYDGHEGYYTCIYNVSDKLFNDDDNIEILVFYFDEITGNRKSLVCLVDEDSQFIQEVAAYGYLPIVCNFFISAEGTYMLSIKGARDDNNGVSHAVIDLFSLPGTCLSSENEKLPLLNAWPNPGSDCIEIPYQLKTGTSSTMQIYDLKGTLIEQKTLNGPAGRIQLQTSQYQKGVYIYNYDGTSNKFIVN